MSGVYQSVFTSGAGDEYRRQAEIRCIENSFRIEGDNLIYNAFGVAVVRYLVVRYLGGDERGLRFENLRLETEWEKAKILRGE